MSKFLESLNKIFCISSIMSQTSLAETFKKRKNKSKRERKARSKTTMYLSSFILLFIITGVMTFVIYQKLSLANQLGVMKEELISDITMIFIASFVINFTAIFSVFFLSKDNETYLHLPISPLELFFARFFTGLKFTFLIDVVILLPLFIAYPIVAAPPAAYYFSAILLFLAIPFIEISLTFVIGSIVGTIVNLPKHKDLVMVLLTVLLILGVLIFEFYFFFSAGYSASDGSTSDISAVLREQIISMSNSFAFMEFFYFLPLAGFMLANGIGFLYSLAFFAVALAILLISLFIAHFTYLRNIIGSGDGKGRKKRISHDKINSLVEKNINSGGSSKLSNLLFLSKLELKKIFRSPTHVFQLVFPVVIFPLLMIGILFFVSVTSSEAFPNFAVVALDSPLIFIIGVLGSFFFTMMSMFSSTAISREGKNVILYCYLPVDDKEVIRSKIGIGIAINIIVNIITVISISLIINLNLLFAVAIILTTIPLNILINYLQIFLDARYGKVNWQNEIEIYKTNIVILYAMIADIVVLILAGIVLLPFFFFSINIFIPMSITIVIFSVLTFFVVKYVEQGFNGWIKKLEV